MSKLYLPYQQLKETAQNILLKDEYIYSQLPIDIDLLAENLGFYIIPVANFKQKITKEAFLSPRTKEIRVDQDLYNNEKLEFRYRFAIAHEVAHYYLHFDYYNNLLENITEIEEWIAMYLKIPEEDLSLFEYQANVTAGCLLIPDKHLDKCFEETLQLFNNKINEAKNLKINRDSYLDYIKDGIAQKLSPKFNVSTEAMILRFKDYKYEDQIP